MAFTTMTIGNLCVSPYNARRNKVDANAIEGMAESLLNRGQLYPLVVHRMPGEEDLWGAFAGGRRYRAFKLLRFVGEAAYRDAGGRYELDLFADEAEQRGRIVDEGLLKDLVEGKLSSMRDLLRKQSGRADLRFEKDYPKDPEYGGIARALEIVAEPKPRSAADGRRLEFVENEMAELEAKAAILLGQPDTPERAELIAAIDVDYVPLETEWQKLRDRRRITLPDGDLFGTLVIEPDGELEIRWWWASRKAKRLAEKPAESPTAAKPVSLGPIPKPEAQAALRQMMPAPKPGGGAIDQRSEFGERNKAGAAIKQDHGATADGVQVLRSLRREVLRCALLDNADEGGTIGRDYAVWCLLRFELVHDYGTDLGARRLASGYDAGWEVSQPHIMRSIAGMRWEKEIRALQAHPSMARADGGRRGDSTALAAAFRAYLDEGPHWMTKTAALLAGLMLERSLDASGYQVPLHDLLATEIGLKDVDIAAYVEPTEELIDLFPRAQRLALVEPHADTATFTALGKLKAAELSAPVARALKKVRGWVHPLMRFAAPIAADKPKAKAPPKRSAA